MKDASQVLAALDAVRDPELDEPVTALGFVASCTLSDEGVAEVRLRLPTYFCAPNFAFLMVADAYDAVSAVEGVVRSKVVLEDHFVSDKVNRGVAAQAGFTQAFEGEATDELGQLRTDFLRKAVLAGTDRVCRPLLATGRSPEELVGMALGEVPASADLDRLRARRADLGLPARDNAPLLIDPATGEVIDVESLPLYLRRARITRVSLEANAVTCLDLFARRYRSASGNPDDHPVAASC